jgi:hypothetical protein
LFVVKKGRGRSSQYCSTDCKSEGQKRRKTSEDYLMRQKIHWEKQKEKNRLKTQTKTRVCKNCGSNHQRIKTWYCSDDCTLDARQKRATLYSQRDEVAEKRRIREKSREYRDKKNEFNRKRNKERRENDPFYAMKERIRNRTKAAFLGQGFTKGCKTRDMIGCTWEFFKQHIESQFTKGMKWSNRELWHIDHIIPLASAATEEELVNLSHFSNLRPLWAYENNLKKDKIIDCQPELLIKL